MAELVPGVLPKCGCCGDVIHGPAAFVTAPPKDDVVQTFHVCDACYGLLIEPALL